MHLKISHTTRYRYDEPVDHGLQRLRLIPRSGMSQTVRTWKVSPLGATVEAEYDDHYGNRVMLLNIDPDSSMLEIRVTGEIDTVDNTGVLGPHRGHLPLWVYRRDTALTAPGEGIGAMAEGFGDHDGNDLSLLHALSAKIGESVEYRSGTTTVTTTAEGALENGSGVCQDQTHIFLAAARHLGYPVRYISGYLKMNDRVEQDAGHAWAEAHVEGLGWVGFDISNAISPDTGYVRVATGLDYDDAAPIRGMRRGAGLEKMSVELRVAPGSSQSQSQSGQGQQQQSS